MSAKKAAPKKAAGPSFIFLICKAIAAVRGGRKGASRAAIANYMIKNNGKTAGGMFNAHLRNALKKGIAAGIIKQGETAQRFKLDEKAKSITNPPKPKKKKAPKKKSAKKSKKKKKTTKKKKKVTKKKKKTTKKKKKTTKKKPAKKTTKKTTKKKSSKKTAKKKSAKKGKK